jgi:hypothetical protein
MKRFFDKDVVKITYLAVGIFIVVYVIIQILPFKLSTSWQPVALAIAILLAAPLIFSLLWERLTSIKVFGVEVGLSEVAQPASDIPVIDSTDPIFQPPSIRMMQEIRINIIFSINQSNDTKLAKINLGQGHTWRIVFLYLLIAFLEDESETQQIVFVDNVNGQEERFIGLGAPASIRLAIASKFPDLETAYRRAYANSMGEVGPGSGESSIGFLERKVQYILRGFLSYLLDGQRQRQKEESDIEINIFEIWVSSGQLENWLKLANNGVRLTKAQIDTLQADRKFTPSLLSIIINQANGNINTFRIDTSTRFLALIQGEKLILIVDLLQLAVITAADATPKT